MKLNEILNELGKAPKDITKIYRGLDHHCRCGCGGVYHDDPNAKGFKMAINKLSKNDFEDMGEGGVEFGQGYVNIPYDGSRDMCYTIYFK